MNLEAKILALKMGEILQGSLRISFVCVVGMEKVTVTTLPALMT